MKLTFTGSGSAFTVGGNNYQSNMILEDDFSIRMLIGCGTDIRLALYDLGLSALDIDDVYVSHLHCDHVGGLEWFALVRKFNSNNPSKPCLHISGDLVDDLWNKVLSGGLNTLKDCHAELTSYFEVDKLSHGKFSWQGVQFDLIPMFHAISNYTVLPSYGLFFCAGQQSIYITGDIPFCYKKIEEIYQKASIIFHDCETCERKSIVHASYDDLVTLDPLIKAKMWLYNYSPGPLPDAKKEGFQGFVKKGQTFDFSKPKTLYV
ncbi:MAG: MBL fold metallo-hydrolase [Parachlamydiaceae bacterium]|nr:MBL fold metallo-hydrolase [Parachlamydiaceae bacterium]